MSTELGGSPPSASSRRVVGRPGCRQPNPRRSTPAPGRRRVRRRFRGPSRRGHAVVKRRRVRVLRRQPVVDADDDQARADRELLGEFDVTLGAQDDPTTAVEINKDGQGLAGSVLRREEQRANVTGRTGYPQLLFTRNGTRFRIEEGDHRRCLSPHLHWVKGALRWSECEEHVEEDFDLRVKRLTRVCLGRSVLCHVSTSLESRRRAAS